MVLYCSYRNKEELDMFAKNLKYLRAKRGYDQQTFAEMIHRSVSTVVNGSLASILQKRESLLILPICSV
ncbi:hypothetical protein J1_30 [Lactobacillus phage J-1]|uniref:Uncharacterized protein n=1 Tax=Lactobacillus phage J-1 TaxID=1414736 RepID=U5U6Z6_9CAUD|nr:hypothetical protein J1_30 [Lactobacillus phage J-1]AGZ17351.1 hypothetical protein J1_30 [Lactobacillus phage J-1]